MLIIKIMQTSRHSLVCAVVAACLIITAGGLRGDRVYFKNGRSIEGIIREERDDAVVIGLGLGSMTIKREQIDRVERDTGAANEDQQSAWRKRYCLHERYVPKGFEALGAAFRGLKASRDGAVKAKRNLSATDKEELELNRKLSDVAMARKALSTQIAASSPQRDVRAYNALVAKHNTLAAEAALLQGKLEEAENGRHNRRSVISAYQDDLLSFRRQFDAAANDRDRREFDEATQYFLAQVGKQLEAYEKEFSDVGARALRRGDATIVQAVVNGRRQGLFLVDTGATLVALSETFARKLGIRMSSLPETEVTVADGRHVKARLALLRSVKVGDTSVENVRAVIMPGDVQKDIDGLLGMSFLRHFNVRLGGNAGGLQLKQFSPE